MIKRHKHRPFKDIIVVDDAATIRALQQDLNIDRQFKKRGLLNRFRLQRSLTDLSYKDKRFPHILPEADAERQLRHIQLWEQFNAKAAHMATGPQELEPIAAWIRGNNNNAEPGILAQQLIGQFFIPDFKANDKTWEAALVFHEAAIMTNIFKWCQWQLTGKATRAKVMLAAATNNDIVAMHGIGVAIHNLVASIHTLRSLYQNNKDAAPITPDEAVELSLSAPPVVLRQALATGAANGCPYSKFTLFMLRLKDANRDNQAKDLIFMSGTRSRCPAEQWIPAVIKGIWTSVHKNTME